MFGGLCKFFNLGNSQQLSQVDQCQTEYLTNVQANKGQQILSKHDSPMKDFIASAWPRFQSRDKSRLPGGQIHISTCMKGVTTCGRQHGGRKLTGVQGSGEGSGHTKGQHRLLQPCTQHSATFTLTGGDSRHPQTPAGFASVVGLASSPCHQTMVSLPGMTALPRRFPFSVCFPGPLTVPPRTLAQ